MKKLWVAGLAVLLAGCQTAPDNIVQGKEVPVTGDFAKAVDFVVRSKLKDPYSAVMGPARARGRLRNGIRELVICGYVNAKNSFGGYNGQQIYIGVYNDGLKRFDLVAMGDQSENASLMIASSCSAAGIPVT